MTTTIDEMLTVALGATFGDEETIARLYRAVIDCTESLLVCAEGRARPSSDPTGAHASVALKCAAVVFQLMQLAEAFKDERCERAAVGLVRRWRAQRSPWAAEPTEAPGMSTSP